MQKLILKMKIGMTNIRRVLVSLLFINISINKVFGIPIQEPEGGPIMTEVSCYARGGPMIQGYETIFILFIPILLIIWVILIIIKKLKKGKKDDKQEN